MNRPKTSDCRPTYVERLERIAGDVTSMDLHKHSDYKVLRELLQGIDEALADITVEMPEDDYSDLREPMQ